MLNSIEVIKIKNFKFNDEKNRNVKNQDVLLSIDNVFRFVKARVEVSDLFCRMLSTVGYQITLVAETGTLQ